jgi:heavy metal sensor kinase
MKELPIRIRLTAWYFLVLAITFGVFAILAYAQMRQSILSAVDAELRNRAQEFQDSLSRGTQPASPEAIVTELEQHAQGDLVQIADRTGEWLYRSPVILQYESSLPDIKAAGDRPQLLTIIYQSKPLRVFTTNISVGGASYRVQLAEPIRSYQDAINRFAMLLWLSLPILLFAASIGGYLMSTRALRPVDRITNTAVAITARNLSTRLAVPQANDELRRLSETLNAMFERLEEAFKRITRFTADASHELRTPLALMRTTAELSLKRPQTETEYREALSSIVADVEATSNIIDSLLFLARAEDGSELFDKQRVDLVEIVRDAGNKGQIIAGEKQIAMSNRIEPRPLWIEGDAASLRRLFIILIDNAIKYTPAQGKVSLALESANGCALFEIRDTGIGISASDLPHVFERFFRADKARTRQNGGVGLGLSIGKQIVEGHGGTAEVESILGKGSVFRVRLPLTLNESISR